jgi:peptide-O-fucosyltransferase
LQKRACEHASEGRQNLFGSWQCLGHKLEHGTLTPEMCFPSKQTVLKQIKRESKCIKAKAIFVAADSDSMLGEIEQHLQSLMVGVLICFLISVSFDSIFSHRFALLNILQLGLM